MIRTVLFDTSFGRVWILQLALAILLLASVLVSAPRSAITVIAAGALASQAWIGHAAMGDGLRGVLSLGTMVVHLLAAGAWLGGLVPLASLLLDARRAEKPLGLACTALRRFSWMGYVAVSLILLTGTANAYVLVGSAGSLSTTAYGAVLLVKLALVALLISVALANRFYLLPRLGPTSTSTSPRCRPCAGTSGSNSCSACSCSVS
jgi:copper resistance protein D